MQRPNDAIEKQFNDSGIFFLEAKRLEDPSFEGAYLGLEIDIALPPSATEVTAPDFSVSILNKRGVCFLATNWRIVEENDQRILRFQLSERLPERLEYLAYEFHRDNLAMTFMDLCYYAGNEAIPEAYEVDTFTKQRPETDYCDLGWIMPSRFVDFFIDALGKLNDSMLGGMAEHAILYGPQTWVCMKRPETKDETNGA